MRRISSFDRIRQAIAESPIVDDGRVYDTSNLEAYACLENEEPFTLNEGLDLSPKPGEILTEDLREFAWLLRDQYIFSGRISTDYEVVEAINHEAGHGSVYTSLGARRVSYGIQFFRNPHPDYPDDSLPDMFGPYCRGHDVVTTKLGMAVAAAYPSLAEPDTAYTSGKLDLQAVRALGYASFEQVAEIAEESNSSRGTHYPLPLRR